MTYIYTSFVECVFSRVYLENCQGGPIRQRKLWNFIVKPMREDSRTLQKANHQAETDALPPLGRAAFGPTYQPPRRNVSSPPPPRLHLHRPLS